MTRLSFFLLLGLVFPLVFASPPNYEHNREHNLLGRNDVLFTRSKLAGAKVVVDDRAKRLLRRTNSDEGGSQAKGGQPAKRKTAREKKPQQSQEQRQIQEEPLLQRIRQKAQELEYLRKLALVEYLQEAGREVTPEGWKLLDGMGRSEVERTLEREVFSRQVVEGMAKKKALAWDCDVNFMCLPEIIVLPRAQIERWAVCTDAARSNAILLTDKIHQICLSYAAGKIISMKNVLKEFDRTDNPKIARDRSTQDSSEDQQNSARTDINQSLRQLPQSIKEAVLPWFKSINGASTSHEPRPVMKPGGTMPAILPGFIAVP